MDTWKVIVDYDASRSIDEQDAVDQEIDRLAEAAGVIIDSGAGSGFGRRDLDYTYKTEEAAAALSSSLRSVFIARPQLGLTVRVAKWQGEDVA